MSQFLILFPRLQPLVAAMSWDLLHGNTTGRRKLMRLLWTSKSQVIRLEESSLYGSQSDEVIVISETFLYVLYLWIIVDLDFDNPILLSFIFFVIYVYIYLQISCVEHLCDSLCYQLDLASFVACVNSGRPWDSKSSLLLSVKEEIPFTDEDCCMDPFVENFVLERLSVQSPLRVRLAFGPSNCSLFYRFVYLAGFFTMKINKRISNLAK